jgi:hypothetical protein
MAATGGVICHSLKIAKTCRAANKLFKDSRVCSQMQIETKKSILKQNTIFN